MESGHYHLHLKAISKRKGHRIHAAVAYRHGTREITAQQAAAYRHAQQSGNGLDAYDYRHKIGVQWFGIFAPKHAPEWCRDPRTLWAAVDATEHRINARLAQEIILALPHQVGQEDHIAMLREFVTINCIDRYGMIADVAIHLPPRNGDARNVHAHILLSDRPITANGFAKTKDRRYQDKGLVNELRAAWSACHNQHMERLGLPYRIDHRSLDAQREDALQRGDTIAALDLDRTPQIHVGKALHVTHPDRTIYIDRRTRNAEILTRNKTEAAVRADRMRGQIARADNAAYLEARLNAIKLDTWQPPELDVSELRTLYGRPDPTSTLGRLRAAAISAKAAAWAMDLSRQHGHPWRPDGHLADAPSILSLILPNVKDTGPGHPVFTVTARDIAFAFYGWGIISQRELQSSLNAIVQEEQRLFADREARKKKPITWLPVPKPPRFPTPHAEHLARLRAFAPVPENIYLKRLAQLNAFMVRHQAKAQRRSQRLGVAVPGRRRAMASAPTSG